MRALLLAGLAVLALGGAAQARTPVPTVSGPLPQSEASHAFGGRKT